jgi:hypothetical protein
MAVEVYDRNLGYLKCNLVVDKKVMTQVKRHEVIMEQFRSLNSS